MLIHARKRSCGKVMFSQACVSHSVHRRGCHIPLKPDTPPGTRHPPPERTWDQTESDIIPLPPPPPQPQRWTVRVLLKCFLVGSYKLQNLKWMVVKVLVELLQCIKDILKLIVDICCKSLDILQSRRY